MAWWNIKQTEVVTSVYIVEADDIMSAEALISEGKVKPVDIYTEAGDIENEVDGPFDSEEAAS